MKAWLGLTVAALALSLMGAGTSPDVLALSEFMPRASMAGESFYFVMTDRYANGDPSNDGGSSALAAGLAAGGFKPSDSGYFHGGDFIGLADNLDRVRAMGFSAIWITPPFVQRAVQGASAGYHGYWGVDFTRIDPHLGAQADFQRFIDKAKSLNLKVFLDVVMNHTADVNQYEGGDAFTSTPKTHAYIPIGLEAAKSPAFLNILANYHNQGSIADWNSAQQYRQGDFAGLDDIKTENAEVIDGFARSYADWILKYGISGFRIDTAKHVDEAFFSRWIPKLVSYVRSVKPDFAVSAGFDIFGEIYDERVPAVSSYIRDGVLPSALDFPLQKVLVDFASGYGTAKEVARTLAWDDFYNVGSNDGRIANAYSLAVFGGNHDMGRLANLLGAGTDSVRQMRFAMSLLFLIRGAPVVYYGDEVGMIGEGGDKAARQDMFPTQVAAWQHEERVGAPPIGRNSSLTTSALRHPIAKHITALNAVRAKHPALATGAMLSRSSKGNVLAWSRLDARDRREFLVVANAGGATSARVVTSTPNSVFTGVFGTTKRWNSDAKGRLSIPIPAQTSLVLRAGKRLPVAAAPVLSTQVSRSPLTGGALVSAKAGRDPLTVTFVGRECGDCPWRRLGTDDAAPFRLALPTSILTESFEVLAVSRTGHGERAVGPITRVSVSALGLR